MRDGMFCSSGPLRSTKEQSSLTAQDKMRLVGLYTEMCLQCKSSERRHCCMIAIEISA